MILVKSFASDTSISFWKIQEVFCVKLCCFVCPVGFVANKSKDKRLQCFRAHQVKQISP